MERRDILRFSIAAGGLASSLRAQQAGGMEGMAAHPADKKPTDTEPHVNDIEKYPKCNYCGMDRRKFHFSRMLIDYTFDVPDPLCSLRCAASSLATKLGREPKAIWVADNASAEEVKPLTNAEKATYLVASKLPTVMSKRSKTAYSTAEAAEASRAVNGGEVVDFDKVLLAVYADIAESIPPFLKTRDERIKRKLQQRQQQEQKQGQ